MERDGIFAGRNARYRAFLNALAALRRFEPYLSALPVGAQHDAAANV
jgi:hypothetical protein